MLSEKKFFPLNTQNQLAAWQVLIKILFSHKSESFLIEI